MLGMRSLLTVPQMCRSLAGSHHVENDADDEAVKHFGDGQNIALIS